MELFNETVKQKYSIGWLKSICNADEKRDFVLFWGHRPSKDGMITKSCLSQWWKCRFEYEGKSYCCMEQFMMAAKAELFNDREVLGKILSEEEPGAIKDLGRKVRGFDPKIWDSYKYTIVFRGNLLKFGQNIELREYLISTGDSVLAEASPYDGIWGIKLSESDERAKNPYRWCGENLLGFALMEVRDSLK